MFTLLTLLPIWSSGQANSPAAQTFPDTRIVNGHSVETGQEGEMKFIIAHRFGRVNGGVYEFLGLDQSTIRIGLDYGIKDWLAVGFGRSSFEKTYDGFFKIKFISQKHGKGGFPLSATFYADMAIKTLKWPDPERKNYVTSRLYYTFQFLLARKFHDRFSLQLMPTMVHRNIVATANEQHDVFAIGSAARLQLSKTISLNAEYYFVITGQLLDGHYNSMALGIDVETRGHVFQFHFGNSRGMIEKFFVTETTGRCSKGDIHFGFNISRDFRIKGRKNKKRS